jgi:Cu(I)/Ag(I) efflux system membrane fusion protein
MNEQANQKKKSSRTGYLIVPILIIVALIIGYMAGSRSAPPVSHDTSSTQVKKIKFWTCAMHPEVQLPDKGLCPKCNMALVPEYEGDQHLDLGPRQLAFGENALKLMEVETATVERRFVETTIRMVGKVDYDESRLAYLSAWAPGRLERLFVDYTGIQVQKGDHMVELYSPELLSAQKALLEANKAYTKTKDSIGSLLLQTTRKMVADAREKLRLLGLAPEQIAEIEQSGQLNERITIYAPMGGIVIDKQAVEGMYVRTGTPIYTIADLGHVWIKLDAYESDLQWLGYGQKVEFTAVAHPGETFSGTIAFIDPVLNEKTRTVKVRVNVPNSDGHLKPEMFVRAIVTSSIAAGGKTITADLVDKWMCPMHPEIVKDDPGHCDICEMSLRQTEELGYTHPGSATEEPLVIPVTAALVTGSRAVVYVKLPRSDRQSKDIFEGREVELGPRAGNYYLVRRGLAEGEQVVVKGNFKIDSALQIQAKPSMMAPSKGESVQEPIPSPFREQLTQLFTAYIQMQQSLADDNIESAQLASGQITEKLALLDVALLPADSRKEGKEAVRTLQKILEAATKVKDVEDLRKTFQEVSDQTIDLARRFGAAGMESLYIHHCPMAFDNTGADWLQTNEKTLNPYFGASMLHCGKVIETIEPLAIWQEQK